MEASERSRPRSGRLPLRQNASRLHHLRRRPELDNLDQEAKLKTPTEGPHSHDHEPSVLVSQSFVEGASRRLACALPKEALASEDSSAPPHPPETPPDVPVVIDPEKLPLSHPCHPQHRISVPAPKLEWTSCAALPPVLVFWKKRFVFPLFRESNLCSWVYCSLVLLVASLVYWNALGCGFVFDDISAIKENRDLRPHTPISNLFLHDFWGTPMQKEQSHKSYRPLCVLTFRLNYLAHALQPMGYHLVNMLLHAVVCGLYYRMCSLFLPELSSFIAALLFAVHPVHTEAVTGVVGRAETLSSIFFIGSLLAYSAATRKLLPRPYGPLHPGSASCVSCVQGGTTCTSASNGSPSQGVSITGSSSCVAASSPSPGGGSVRQYHHHNSNNSNNHHHHRNGVSSYNVLSSANGLGVGSCFNSYVQPAGGARSPRYGAPRSSSGSRSGGRTRWRWLGLSVVLASCAMLCKEQGITVMAVCALYELVIVQKVRGWDLLQFGEGLLSGKGSVPPWLADCAPRMFALVATTLGLMLARVHIMGAQLPVFTRFDNPASVSETPVRQLTYNYLVSVNAWLLLMPATLCCDWTMGTVPLVTSFLDPRNLATLATYAALAKLAHHALFCAPRQHAQALLMGLGFLVLPFLPASNLFFPVGFVVAERVLYMPSMGFCLIVAHGFSNLLHRVQHKRSAWLGLLFLLSVHALKTHVRNADWKDEYTVFTAGLKVNQRNAKLFNNVGHALESEGRFGEALAYFQAAVTVQEDDIGAHINVGRTFNNLKRYIDAEDAYLKAKSLLPKAKPGESYQARIAPNHLNVFLNLANLIARNSTRLEEADSLYRQAISMRADYTQAYINRGDILIKMNRTKEAQEVYERALFYDSTNPDIYYNLGVVLLERGRAQQALAYLDKALEMDPDHQQALLNSAVLIQESGNAALRPVAVSRLLRLVQKDPKNERVYFNLGMIAMDDNDHKSAENWFRKAVELKEDFRSALFNLALLLTDDGRPLEAAPFLNQLVKHHPDHVKGLILLGDIYINNIKDLDAAEKCYERILAVDPGNVQGLHNLCVVYVERGELLAAESCLARAHTIAPTEDYILRHLNIVRSRLAKYNGSQPPPSHDPSTGTESEESHQYNLPEFHEPHKSASSKQKSSSASGNSNNSLKNNERRTKTSENNEINNEVNNNYKIKSGSSNINSDSNKPLGRREFSSKEQKKRS